MVSTMGYGAFVPAALAFGLFSCRNGIFAASAFVIVPLSVMCLAVARGRRLPVLAGGDPGPAAPRAG